MSMRGFVQYLEQSALACFRAKYGAVVDAGQLYSHWKVRICNCLPELPNLHCMRPINDS